jgi:hypothetical protein
LQQIANDNKLTNNANYKAWVASHPPETILAANIARARLVRKYKSKPLRKITDDRLPKRPATPYALFIRSRWASGDLQYDKISGVFSSLAAEWKVMTESEKKASP